MDRLLRALGVMYLAGAVGFVLLFFGRGRPEANAHPDVRGGGDLGFGGSDFYAEEKVA